MRRWLHELPCKFPECLPVQSRTLKTALLHIAADFRAFAENSLVYNHPPLEQYYIVILHCNSDYSAIGRKMQYPDGIQYVLLCLLLRKLNLVPYPVQLAEINTERKVQQ